jgi:hypothetical protein
MKPKVVAGGQEVQSRRRNPARGLNSRANSPVYDRQRDR